MIVICMGLYYGWWTWNGTPTLYFFPPVGGGVGKLGFQNRLGNPPESVGNLIRRGNEPTTTDAHRRMIPKYRGRIRGHMALFGLEYTLFSIISLEIGEDTSRIPLGDYRGNIINSIPLVGSALSVCECIVPLSSSHSVAFFCSVWFGFCHQGVVQTLGKSLI